MKLITTFNKGQTQYLLDDREHLIKSLSLNGRKVNFRVFLEIEKEPKEYGMMQVSLRKGAEK